MARRELNANLQWKFFKSVTGTNTCDNIPQCNELYIVVFPGNNTICYEFIIPWISILDGVELYLNNGYGFASNNNLVRISYMKSNNKATIKNSVMYENGENVIDTTKTNIYYR